MEHKREETEMPLFEFVPTEWRTFVDHFYDEEDGRGVTFRRVRIRGCLETADGVSVNGAVLGASKQILLSLSIMEPLPGTKELNDWPEGVLTLYDEAKELKCEVQVPEAIMDDLVAVIRTTGLHSISLEAGGDSFRPKKPRDREEGLVMIWEPYSQDQSVFKAEVTVLSYQTKHLGGERREAKPNKDDKAAGR